MKKTMILAALAAATMTAGAKPLDYKTCTEQEVREVLAEALAASNNWWICANTNHLWSALRQSRFDAIRLEADDALAKAGKCYAKMFAWVGTFPKLSALARATTDADTAYAKSIAIARRLGCDISPSSFLRLSARPLDDVSELLSEAVAFPAKCTAVWLPQDGWKKNMQKVAVKAVKKYIRSQGRSFVAKDGVNPCEAYMTALTAALNAPRFAGLDAWYKSIGLAGVDLSALPSEAEVAQLRQDVLDGTKDMDERNKTILCVCLGVDGYNAFVKEYNGDK